MADGNKYLLSLHLQISSIGDQRSLVLKQETRRMENQMIDGMDVIAVQYVESSLSELLLGKFPDNSAFDFDYSQSALWSPHLIRRFHHLIPERKTSLENDRCMITFSKIKKKLHLNFILGSRRLKLDCKDKNSNSPYCFESKVWQVLVKMTSKQFKRRKKDPISYVKKLSDYLRHQNC